MTARASAAGRPQGVLVLAAIMLALVATGAPVRKTVERLMALGVPEGPAVFAMYALPVAALLALLPLGRFLAKGRPQRVRWVIYAVSGMLVGITLGLCLDLFAHLAPAIGSAIGPLAEPTMLDTFLWIVSGWCVVIGALLGVIAVFGQGGIRAIQVEDVDNPECLEVMQSERGVFAWAAFGMATMGLGCAALAVVRQAPEDARLTAAIIAIAACAASAWSNHVLWRGFDEMQRRHVVEGYAVSAIILTLGAFAWALAQSLALVPPLDATGVFLTLIVVQMIATSFVTASVMGQSTMFGKPA